MFNDLKNKYDLTPPSSTSVSKMFKDFEADKELIINTKKRAKKYGCFDKYQKSKKEKESIYFQF